MRIPRLVPAQWHACLQLVAEVPVYRPVFAAGFEGSDGVVDVVEQLLR